jgi:hypothetical protein
MAKIVRLAKPRLLEIPLQKRTLKTAGLCESGFARPCVIGAFQ